MFWPHNGWIEMCLRSELDSTNICLLVLCYIRSSRRAYLLINTILPFLYPVSTHPQTDDLFSLSLLFCKLTQNTLWLHSLFSLSQSLSLSLSLSFSPYLYLSRERALSFSFFPSPLLSLSLSLYFSRLLFLFQNSFSHSQTQTNAPTHGLHLSLTHASSIHPAHTLSLSLVLNPISPTRISVSL